MQKSSSFLLPSLPKGVQIKPNVCQKTWNCSAANFFMKEIAKHSKMHCNMFFHSILYPFLPYYSGNTLDSLSVICAALTCTFSTMTKSTFCNATTNYGDSEALQKCLILSAKINHFANQSNYSMTQVWNWSVQAVGEEGEECDEERSSSKIKEIWRSIFVDHQSLLYIWSDLKWCRVGCPGPTREAFSGPQLKLDPPYEVGHFPEKKILDFWLPQFHSRAMTVYIPKYTRKAFQQLAPGKCCPPLPKNQTNPHRRKRSHADFAQKIQYHHRRAIHVCLSCFRQKPFDRSDLRLDQSPTTRVPPSYRPPNPIPKHGQLF